MNYDDPLFPAQERFPINPLFIAIDHSPPSNARPFILRGHLPFRAPAVDGVINVRHRTDATQRKIPEETNLDNKVVDDSYTVPDE